MRGETPCAKDDVSDPGKSEPTLAVKTLTLCTIVEPAGYGQRKDRGPAREGRICHEILQLPREILFQQHVECALRNRGNGERPPARRHMETGERCYYRAIGTHRAPARLTKLRSESGLIVGSISSEDKLWPLH